MILPPCRGARLLCIGLHPWKAAGTGVHRQRCPAQCRQPPVRTEGVEPRRGELTPPPAVRVAPPSEAETVTDLQKGTVGGAVTRRFGAAVEVKEPQRVWILLLRSTASWSDPSTDSTEKVCVALDPCVCSTMLNRRDPPLLLMFCCFPSSR